MDDREIEMCQPTGIEYEEMMETAAYNQSVQDVVDWIRSGAVTLEEALESIRRELLG